MEIEGAVVPAAGLSASRLLIDGDRFRTESPEAIYEGVFNINVETEPHEIDIEFVAGPEAGNWNYGIFRLQGDSVEFCLNIQGDQRPKDFHTVSGSGCAYEVLKRTLRGRPDNVTGGTAPFEKPSTPARTLRASNSSKARRSLGSRASGPR